VLGERALDQGRDLLDPFDPLHPRTSYFSAW
jgi:hypothetical protein